MRQYYTISLNPKKQRERKEKRKKRKKKKTLRFQVLLFQSKVNNNEWYIILLRGTGTWKLQPKKKKNTNIACMACEAATPY